ncbi:hypothetical protein KCU81_g343, partial [Aureobasidium melanogenum]
MDVEAHAQHSVVSMDPLLSRDTKNFSNLAHLVSLKWHCLLGVLLCFLTLENWSQTQELGKYAADCPCIDRWCVMSASKLEVVCKIVVQGPALAPEWEYEDVGSVQRAISRIADCDMPHKSAFGRKPWSLTMVASPRFVAGFVHPAIGATADETYYVVVIIDSPLASISHRRHLELGGLLVGAAEAFTEGGTFGTAEVEVIMAAD